MKKFLISGLLAGAAIAVALWFYPSQPHTPSKTVQTPSEKKEIRWDDIPTQKVAKSKPQPKPKPVPKKEPSQPKKEEYSVVIPQEEITIYAKQRVKSNSLMPPMTPVLIEAQLGDERKQIIIPGDIAAANDEIVVSYEGKRYTVSLRQKQSSTTQTLTPPPIPSLPLH